MFNKLATLAKAGLKLLENAPVGGLIKAGVLIGVAGFTCWVMIKRTLKMRKEAQESESGLFRSPVDDLLNNNYVANPDAYDDLDPEARRICKELNKSWKKSRKSKKKKASKKSVHPRWCLSSTTMQIRICLIQMPKKMKMKRRRWQMYHAPLLSSTC